MTSSDREILLAIQGEVRELRMIVDEQGQRITRMEQRQETLAMELRHTNDKIDWMQHTIYWGFAIIGIIIALFALRPQEHAPKPSENDSTLLQDVAELFKLMRRDKPE